MHTQQPEPPSAFTPCNIHHTQTRRLLQLANNLHSRSEVDVNKDFHAVAWGVDVARPTGKDDTDPYSNPLE